MAASWYLVHAQTGREVVAEANLVRQGFRAFLPARLGTIRHARKTQAVRSALFPGYLFVAIDVEVEPWRSINGTTGVIRLIGANNRPVAAPDGLVETLIRLSPNGVVTWRPVLNPGDHVRLDEGPFAGAVGRVETLSGAERVRVLLDVMNRSAPVELLISDCVPA